MSGRKSYLRPAVSGSTRLFSREEPENGDNQWDFIKLCHGWPNTSKPTTTTKKRRITDKGVEGVLLSMSVNLNSIWGHFVVWNCWDKTKYIIFLKLNPKANLKQEVKLRETKSSCVFLLRSLNVRFYLLKTETQPDVTDLLHSHG